MSVPAPRFFVDADLRVDTTIDVPEHAAHHAQHALRLRDGDPVVLFNGRGGEYAARLRAGRAARAEVVAFDPVERESPLAVTLLQALASSDRTDRIVEKSVELGVAAIVLAPSARSVLRLDGGSERTLRKLAHWREIALAACCQCGRNRVPAIDLATSFDAALFTAQRFGRRFVLSPGAGHELVHAVGAAAALAEPDPGIALAVGPEGGFTDAEVAAAVARGFLPAGLGPRILRTETAGPAALAALQAVAGDFVRQRCTRPAEPA